MGAPDPFAAAAAAIDMHGVGTTRVPRPERVWPDDIPSPAPANAPRILRELKARLSRYLDKPSQWLAQLSAANGSRRQQRSERRLACVQLARAMIKYCDLRTMRIGVPGEAGWIDFTLPYLASQAGLSERRAERALRDLQKARLVKVRRQCELEQTERGVRYKGVASIKYLTSTLFEAFGLGKWLRHERTRAHLRAQRGANQQHKRTHRGSTLGAQLIEQLAALRPALDAKLRQSMPHSVMRPISSARSSFASANCCTPIPTGIGTLSTLPPGGSLPHLVPPSRRDPAGSTT